MSRRGEAYFAAGVLLGFLCGGNALSQISQASLQGSVKDNTGALVPGATVTVKEKGTGMTRSVTTGASGEYAIPNLNPVEYDLSVTARGFSTYTINSLILHTGDSATVNAT